MKTVTTLFGFGLATFAALFASCSKDSMIEPPAPHTGADAATVNPVSQLPRAAFYDAYPSGITGNKTTVSSEAIKLEFYGWGESSDKKFTLNFPTNTSVYNRAILKYRMGAWNQGPSSYDNVTMIMVKYENEWYELVRAFTPYGNSFGANWERYYYFDVTEYLPMLQGATEFKVYYGGFDATSTRAHTVTLTFDLYQGLRARSALYYAKVYDSSKDGNTGYRAFAYGVAGNDIEGEGRLCQKTFQIPDGVEELEMRVAISGHGHDQGTFPDRPGVSGNCAEFVSNTFTVKVDGVANPTTGTIWTTCGNNYAQAGTCYYNRANWCPGNPLMTQYWTFSDPHAGRTLTLDFDLPTFISTKTAPNAEGAAQYIVEVDLVGYKFE